jgi:hypothetical protein
MWRRSIAQQLLLNCNSHYSNSNSKMGPLFLNMGPAMAEVPNPRGPLNCCSIYNSSNINSNWGAGHAADSLSPTRVPMFRPCPSVSLPKTHATYPHQRRRHAAHRPRCGSGAPAGSGRPNLLLGEADVDAVSKQVELALFYDAKVDVAATT